MSYDKILNEMARAIEFPTVIKKFAQIKSRIMLLKRSLIVTICFEWNPFFKLIIYSLVTGMCTLIIIMLNKVKQFFPLFFCLTK